MKFKIFSFILILSFSLLLISNVSFPGRIIMDETYYATAGREIFSTEKEPNWENHPPLAKYLMGIGIKVFGFTGTGWRMGSVFMGILGIIGIYFLVKEISKKEEIAFLTVFLLGFEFLYFTMSRIAMLDIFVNTFIIFTSLFVWEYYERRRIRFLILSGVFFGLALSAKWTTGLIFPILFFLFLPEKKEKSENSKAKQNFWKKALILGSVIFIFYLIPYFPFLIKNGVYETATLQVKIFKNMASIADYKTAKTSPLSPFLWPLAPTNTLSSYGLYGKEIGTMSLIANPLILWLFIPLIIYQFSYALRKKSLNRFFILTIIFCLYIPWLAIDRVRYFYYMLPVMPFLCLLIAMTISDIWNFEKLKKTELIGKPVKKEKVDFLDKIIYLSDLVYFKVKTGKFYEKWQNFCEKLLQNKKLIKALIMSYLFLIVISFILFYPLLNELPTSFLYQKRVTFFWPFLTKHWEF